VSKEYACKGTFSVRNDEVCVDWTTFGTHVGDIAQCAAFELLDDLFMDVGRLLRIVVDQMAGSLKIGCVLAIALSRSQRASCQKDRP